MVIGLNWPGHGLKVGSFLAHERRGSYNLSYVMPAQMIPILHHKIAIVCKLQSEVV